MASPTTDRRQGLNSNVAIKAPVATIATSNITLSGEQTINGVTTSASRVLAVAQTDASQNGVWDTDSGSWSRSADCDGTYDIVTGTLVPVGGGTYLASTWMQTASSVTVGTSSQTWLEVPTLSTNFVLANLYAGVDRTGANDSTTAIQSVIDANPGRTIMLLSGTYKVTDTLKIQAANTFLKGEGKNTTLKQYTVNKDTLQIKPTTAGTTADYLSNVGVVGIKFDHTAVSGSHTSGAAIRVTQCSVYKVQDFIVSEAFEGLTIEGSQLGLISDGFMYATAGSYAGAGTAMLHFRQAAYGGGSYQPCYTCQVENISISATNKRYAAVRVADGDGVTFVGGYWTNHGGNAIVQLTADRSASYISALTIDGIYIDGIDGTTQAGIEIPDNGFTDGIYDLRISDTTTINGCVRGILSRSNQLYYVTFGGWISNCGTWGADFEAASGFTTRLSWTGRTSGNGSGAGGDVRVAGQGNSFVFDGWMSISAVNIVLKLTGSWGRGVISNCVNSASVADIDTTGLTITNPIEFDCNVSAASSSYAQSWTSYGTWTPVLTFATPGDLAVTYSEQAGRWRRQGNSIALEFAVATSAFTFTTASGQLRITGCPATSGSSIQHTGTLSWQGITKAGYTQVAPVMAGGATTITLRGSGSGVALSDVAAADTPTGGTVVLRGELTMTT